MKKLIVALLSLFICLLLSVQSKAIRPEEQSWLRALYNSTNGPEWYRNGGWGGVNDPDCNSEGVTCSGTGDTAVVTELDLQLNNLSGIIPGPNIYYSLRYLGYLNLEKNSLTGPISPGFVYFQSLRDLRLNENNLTGIILPQLSALPLQYLDLSYNQLTGNIPSSFGNLTGLTHLYLEQNLLNGNIPSELGSLSNLTILHLSSNQLSGSIPPELGNLHILKDLLIDYNQLTGSIPPELGKLANLLYLYLNSNSLTGSIPLELMDLKSLSDLKICENHLYTTNPDLRNFLNNLEPDWESCQTPTFSRPMTCIPLLLLGE